MVSAFVYSFVAILKSFDLIDKYKKYWSNGTNAMEN